MGKLEKRHAVMLRRTKIQKAIITTLGVAVVLPIALVAPKVLGALGKLGLLPQQNVRVRNAFARMVKAGYIEVRDGKHGKTVRLTEKGGLFLSSIEDAPVALKKRKWDGKWRVVIYDFHGPAPRLRHRVRRLLETAGFKRLQGSVWISPYDSEDLITLLKTELRIGNGLLYMIVDHIENDRALCARFSLPIQV